MSQLTHRKRQPFRRKLTVQKPGGVLHPRVEKVGPQRFGVVCFDCHKAASKWMFADFYGKVLIEPTKVRHTCPELEMTIARVRNAAEKHHIEDLVVAIERTGAYHLPVKRSFDRADFETRIVHPFATKHYRLPADAGNKTDDADLDAIFRATIAGYGLIEHELDDTYANLRLLARHRRDLVDKRSILCCQIREHMEAVLPGYAAMFDDLWESKIALALAEWVGSVRQFQELGVKGLCTLLRQHECRFLGPTVERIVAWARSAAPPHPQSSMHQRILLTLEEERRNKCRKISDIERDFAFLLVQTPYVLLLSHPGVNVVSAAGLAAEMGPVEHYPHAKSITGRAGIYPSRYQSDEVDNPDGPLVRRANKQLRAAIFLVADNLIKCNSHFRGLASLWKCQGKDARDSRVKVASRFCRILYQLVAGRQVFAHPSQRRRDYVLHKLIAFHRQHETPMSVVLTQLQYAIQQLPRHAHADEAQSLVAELHRADTAKGKAARHISEILPLVLARLGVSDVQSIIREDQGPS
jgi:transposase